MCLLSHIVKLKKKILIEILNFKFKFSMVKKHKKSNAFVFFFSKTSKNWLNFILYTQYMCFLQEVLSYIMKNDDNSQIFI